jgi:hypothetical protein
MRRLCGGDGNAAHGERPCVGQGEQWAGGAVESDAEVG